MTICRAADMTVAQGRGADLGAARADRGGEITDAKMQCGDQTAHRRQRIHVDQTARGFDQQFHFNRCWALPGSITDPATDLRDVRNRLRFRDDEGIETVDSGKPPDFLLYRRTVDGIEPNGDG